MRNDATTKIANSFYSDEGSDSEADTGKQAIEYDDISSKKKFLDLEQRLIETQAQLQQAKDNLNILRSQILAKCKIISRLENKLSSSNIDDVCLKKTISLRLSGYSFTYKEVYAWQ